MTMLIKVQRKDRFGHGGLVKITSFREYMFWYKELDHSQQFRYRWIFAKDW